MSPEPNPARHDRESVARTALALLDEVGFADLSMRRIAARLDLQPSALYWHFSSKQELLADLADRITADVLVDGADVLTTARRIRDALFAHRDGAELVLSTYALRLGSSPAQAALEDALGAERSPGGSERAVAILHFVLGHATLVQQRMHADSHGALLGEGPTDVTAGFDRIFDLGVAALAESVSGPATPPRGRA
ncbi:TetR family transcriptional regulator [Microbacterium sp. SA39]|uniref:TetR family transcriptional regulator n=1 Tax=Microbacterium sp. SA39 TaxID=1263625 RepID=UPI0005FA53ED|nr:TetR family transcriptional regulator [Microbacterium sp. SA39]KJQ55581.1 Tetracycline repressor protein class A from transposon 1721 [Microbacterium sp. SA39]